MGEVRNISEGTAGGQLIRGAAPLSPLILQVGKVRLRTGKVAHSLVNLFIII